jgi:ankyrin repeat protein
LATEHGYTEIVKLLLLEHNADINIKNNEEYTSLMLASRDGYT